MGSPIKEYFASKSGNELAAYIEERVQNTWAQQRTQMGLHRRWNKSYRYYYGAQFKAASLTAEPSIFRLGEQGELAGLTINHYRNFIRHLLIMATNQKIAFEPRAITSDTEALAQARLGSTILDNMVSEHRLGKDLKGAAERALVFGKGFLGVTWDKTQGRPYITDFHRDKDGILPLIDDEGNHSQKVIHEGDISVKAYSPHDVFTDLSADSFKNINWCVIRDFKNKFDLAAGHPAWKNEILGLETRSEKLGPYRFSLQTFDDEADVPQYTFYHKRTPALPNGRMCVTLGGKIVLYDGPIPYSRLPIFRIVPGEILDTTEGYTDSFDLITLQDAMNVIASTTFSNQQALGVQNILVPENANLSASQLGKSLRVLKYNPQGGAPTPLNLVANAGELFKMMELLERWMETISGVNAVARGNPDHSLSSGVALGLVQSMAIQFASGFQQSWAELLEDAGTFILELYKDFAKTERLIADAGKLNRGQVLKFKGDQLSKIKRVTVDLGNPLIRTTAGRLQLADNLLQKGLVKTPQEYLTVLNTGSLDPLTEAPEAQMALIRQENETILAGKPVRALVGDQHLLHMQEHLVTLANPEIRERATQGDPQAVAVLGEANAHIQEHMKLYKEQDPLWAQISGEPPAPMPPMPPGPLPPEQPIPPMPPLPNETGNLPGMSGTI